MLLLRIAAKKGERKHKEEKLEEEYYEETENINHLQEEREFISAT